MPRQRAYVVIAELFQQTISPQMNLRFGVLADDESDALALVQAELSPGFSAQVSDETLSEAEVEAHGLEPYRPRLLARS